ncbi:hypothetical protein LP422_23245 [Janibacter limosus]|uniref:hypothetical protein n=1 Tax=Janibacter limosus TaxID=53458 RepID=UPI0035D8E7D5|nr:hypothetical protein LP422_23245 [Janibacter limosus]
MIPAEERVNEELAQICRTYVTDDPVTIRLTLDLLLGRGSAACSPPTRATAKNRSSQPGPNS